MFGVANSKATRTYANVLLVFDFFCLEDLKACTECESNWWIIERLVQIHVKSAILE